MTQKSRADLRTSFNSDVSGKVRSKIAAFIYHIIDSAWNKVDDAGGPGGAAWGGITGTLSAQTDLNSALGGKSNTGHDHAGIYEPANANIQAHIGSPHAPLQAFPVGSVFIAVISTNPGTLLGYGTWTAFGAGRVMVGLDSGDTDFDVAEETGGAKTVASAGSNAAEASHTHTYSQVPNHVHAQSKPSSGSGAQASIALDTSTTGSVADTISTQNPTGGVAQGTTNAGSSHNHAFTGSATSVVQPYIVVYMWKRTA